MVLIFSSIEFLLFFLPVFIILYWLAPEKYKNPVMLLGSLLFYSLGEPILVLLLLVSIVVNYLLALHLEQGVRQKGKDRKRKKTKYEKRRKVIFAIAIAFNALVWLACKIGMQELPLGISFYSFQMISYLTDIYRGSIKKEKNIIYFATYVTMFPQLISGPIVRYAEVRDELSNRHFCLEDLSYGLKVFVLGLASKVLLADRLTFLWQQVQVTGFESISTPLAWIAAVAYSMKIYFDFFGYSLMAIGLGCMFGFTLPANFDHPYMAGSVREFYRRWHMTLGRWFCQYLYIPLGGSRKGEFRTVCNLLAVWLCTAVWHGNTVNFLIWGMLLCLLIVMERQWDRLFGKKISASGLLKWTSHVYLLAVIPITWMCFAITDFSQLQIYLGRMFGLTKGIRVSSGDWLKALQNYWYLFAVGAVACTPAVSKIFHKWKNSLLFSAILAALFWVCVWRIQVEGQNPFMYSKF